MQYINAYVTGYDISTERISSDKNFSTLFERFYDNKYEKNKKYRFFATIDIYGKTILNNKQTINLITELNSLKQDKLFINNQEEINSLLHLAESVEQHNFLVIIGD